MPSFNSILRASASLGNDLGALEDKIICDLDKTLDFSQRSPQNCPKCGNPIKGHYCQGCAVLRQTFKEDMFASYIKHGIIQDSSEPSNDNSNVVNAPREPFVVNQDLGNNSSQSPPQISNQYCCGCGNLLEGIFCHQCTCKLCGNGAHYGHNCPPKVPILPDPEPFNNHTIDELPPTVVKDPLSKGFPQVVSEPFGELLLKKNSFLHAHILHLFCFHGFSKSSDKHQLKFNSHKDAKTLMEAIEKRFGGNTKTKKVQKTLLKQQFENFSSSSSEGLDQIHDRLQKLVSQLEIHRLSLSQEDVNRKFLPSLPSEW
nr:hypothetical protein [Tanacetum cinerariifolium]